MDNTYENHAQQLPKPAVKRVIRLENLESASSEITGGGGKIYFGESQFDA